jgi:hypothetical protein
MGSVSGFIKLDGHALYSVERNGRLVCQRHVSPIHVFNNPRKRVTLVFCGFVVQVEGGEKRSEFASSRLPTITPFKPSSLTPP